MSLIKVQNLFKFYVTGAGKTYVLRDLNFSVDEGEFVSVMGPSGAGKSTILHILGMIDEPSTGEYFFNEEPVHKLNEKRRTQMHRNHIGFVFQSYHLIDELTVYENLETPLLYKGIKKTERKGMVSAMLDKFQIVAKKDLFPNQLSGGQQQLVGIARALITKPKLILADEPTGNLNSQQGDEIMDLFVQLNEEEGTTIIQVTHSEKKASYGKRIIDLLDGRVQADEILADPDAVGTEA